MYREHPNPYQDPIKGRSRELLPIDYQLLAVAKRQAQKSQMHYRAGAVIVANNSSIVSLGHNRKHPATYTHWPRHSERYQYSLHAEADALRKIPPWIKRRNLSIYTYVETPGRNQTKSYPCQICARLLASEGIREIIPAPTPDYYTRMKGVAI